MIEVTMRDFTKEVTKYRDKSCRLMVKNEAYGVYMPIEEYLGTLEGGKSTEKKGEEECEVTEGEETPWDELATEGSEKHKCETCGLRSHVVFDGKWYCFNCWNKGGGVGNWGKKK